MSRFDELTVGDVVTGRVTKVVPFGALVRVADDADGLLTGEDQPQVGSDVTVRIREIDPINRRASLVKA
jgi:ribosomal protein S1